MRVLIKVVAVGTAALGLGACPFDLKYSVSGEVAGLRGAGLVLEDNSGNALTITGNGGFTFSKTLAKAAAYSVTVQTNPSNPAQTCTARNNTGTIAKVNIVNIVVSCTQAAEYVYVANQEANTISAYAIDSSSGILTELADSPIAANGTSPVSIAVDPNGAYVYVANNASNTVSVFSITDGTGVLSPISLGIPVGSGPSAVVTDPTGRYLYVANTGSNTVSAYSLSSGTATALSTPTYAVGSEPSALATDPAGNYLYVTNFADGTISAFSIDSATGELTALTDSPIAAGSGANSIAVDATSTHTYAANFTAATLSSYTLTDATGILSSIAGSPLATSSAPETIALDPSGQFVFAANVTSDNDIATYKVTPATGALTLASTVVSSGILPIGLAVDYDPSGVDSEYVLAANDTSGTVSVYRVASTGDLTAVGTPLAAGSGARAIALD